MPNAASSTGTALAGLGLDLTTYLTELFLPAGTAANLLTESTLRKHEVSSTEKQREADIIAAIVK
jgi:opacity protein-like surface antigen